MLAFAYFNSSSNGNNELHCVEKENGNDIGDVGIRQSATAKGNRHGPGKAYGIHDKYGKLGNERLRAMPAYKVSTLPVA